MATDLTGLRILLVEDSPVVSDSSEDMLHDFGCEVVGPAGTMAVALELAEQEEIDAAVVDVNIRGGKAFPLLRLLAERKIPFLLTSGYADWTMPDEWHDRPRLPKPYTPTMLRERLLDLLG